MWNFFFFNFIPIKVPSEVLDEGRKMPNWEKNYNLKNLLIYLALKNGIYCSMT